MDSLQMAEKIVRTLSNKKAEDITLLKIEDLTVISDYFVIATATNSTQIKALANEIEYELEKDGVKLLHQEGYDSASWILLDYNGVIVHLFLKDSRMFYSLERLWSDASEVDVSQWL